MSELTIKPISLNAAPSATELVFQSLYDAVISLKLPPGSKVSEADIAKQLDVSRQPVRDAFFRLSQLGFLLIRPQRATLISRISERCVLDATFVREALEIACQAEAIKNMTPRNIARLKNHLERQRDALDRADQVGFHVLDDDFHATICDIAGRTHVWHLIQEQKAHMDRIRFLTLSQERRRKVLAEHTAVVEGMISGDRRGAEKHLRNHLNGVKTALVDVRKNYPQYFDDVT